MMARTKVGIITWLDSPGVNRAMRILGALSLAMVLVVGFQQVKLNSCVVRWIDDNSRITKSRTSAAENDRKALDEMIATITSATSGASVNAALKRYLEIRNAADEQRRQSPLPEAPSTVC
jgi:leucyl-tRNA synthetase